MVGKWRARFVSCRLNGLLDEPRPGAPWRVGDEEVERVLTLTLETRPRDATPWSTWDGGEDRRSSVIHALTNLYDAASQVRVG